MNITMDTKSILFPPPRRTMGQPGNVLFLHLLKEVSITNLPPQIFLPLPLLILLHASSKKLIVNLVVHEITARTTISLHL